MTVELPEATRVVSAAAVGAQEENRRLRRTMRDLVALSTLPAMWSGLSGNAIARSLSDVLFSILALDLIYVRLGSEDHHDIVEVTRAKQRDASRHQAIRAALASLVDADGKDPAKIRNPFGLDDLRVAVVRFGAGVDRGAVVACSSRPEFPTEQDRLLLSVAANQTAIVIDRRRAEQRTHEQREWLQVTLESIADAVIATDTVGRVTFLNSMARDLTGWLPERAVGQQLSTVLPLLDVRSREPIESPIDQVTRTGGRVVSADQAVFIAQDGAELPIDSSAAPIRDTTGNALGFVFVFRAVPEQRRREQLRNARLAVTQTLTQSATKQEAIQGVLQAVCQELGWDIGLFWDVGDRGDSLTCSVHWHTGDAALQELVVQSCKRTFSIGEGLPGRVLASRKPAWIPDALGERDFPRNTTLAELKLQSAFACPATIGNKTLGVIEFFTHSTRAPDADLLEMMGTVTGNLGQFLERKVAEEELADARSRLDAALEAGAIVTWTWDIPSNRLYADTKLAQLFNLPPAESKGGLLDSYVRAIHTEDVERILATLARSVETGEPYEADYRVIQSDGSVRWVSARGIVERDREGKPSKMPGVLVDITERKMLEEELRRRADQLAEADRRKDEFLATLAHELRNPLAPIRNSLEILKMPHVDAAMVQQTRAMMARQVDHLVRLVDDLLDVSRVMRGKIDLRKEPVELATVVARAVETVKPLIEVQGHRLELSLPDDSLLIEVDPVRMAQVIGNLLTNAAKYTEANGRIWLRASREQGQVVLCVKDTGIGIAADLLPHIFELFVQADHTSTKSQGGLGIGLTLARNLIRMHGGSIEAHSAGLGKGSEFVIRLPLVSRLALAECQEGWNEIEQQSNARGHRLLVVDDNKDAALSLATLLRLQGHDVCVAHDGLAALSSIESHRPRIVFLDIGMPGMDGYAVARRIREDLGAGSVILAAITGWGQEGDRRRTAEAGFDYHLVKPVDLNSLQRLLAQLQVMN